MQQGYAGGEIKGNETLYPLLQGVVQTVKQRNYRTWLQSNWWSLQMVSEVEPSLKPAAQ